MLAMHFVDSLYMFPASIVLNGDIASTIFLVFIKISNMLYPMTVHPRPRQYWI